MLKTSSIAAALLVAGSAAALAQSRPSSTTMSCAQAASFVQSHGEVVLGTGGQTYDRYVSDRRYCAATEHLKPAFAPTTDTQYCMVGYTCIEPFTMAPADR